MNFLKPFATVLSITLCAFLIISCKNNSSSETTPENQPGPDATYKEAEFISAEDFEKGMNARNAVILDIRMPQEFENGHIEGAVNMNFFDPNFKNQLLELDKNKKYYIYSKNDPPSERAAEFLLQNDYPEVYVLKGGYTAWQSAQMTN